MVEVKHHRDKPFKAATHELSVGPSMASYIEHVKGSGASCTAMKTESPLAARSFYQHAKKISVTLARMVYIPLFIKI